LRQCNQPLDIGTSGTLNFEFWTTFYFPSAGGNLMFRMAAEILNYQQ